MAVPWHPGGFRPPGYPPAGGGGGGSGGCGEQLGCLVILVLFLLFVFKHC